MNLSKPVAWAIAAAALALGVFAAFATLHSGNSKPKFEGVDVTDMPWGRGFELIDHHGKRRGLADFRGKVVTLFFGYTHCPDMCPLTLAMLGQAMQRLGRDAEGVQGLFVTVDPKRDTPDVLAQYVPAFYPTFLGMYADEATTLLTAKEFKVYFQAQPANEQGSYTVDHSGQVFVFDRKGRLRLFVKPSASPESVAHDLRLLLDAPAG